MPEFKPWYIFLFIGAGILAVIIEKAFF